MTMLIRNHNKEKEKKIAVIDANIFLYKSIYKLDKLDNGGAFGFLKSMLHIFRVISPEKMIIVWDGGRSKRRSSLYSEYKQGRVPTLTDRFTDSGKVKEAFLSQKALLDGILRYFPFIVRTYEGIEADDVIMNYPLYIEGSHKVYGVSSDKDILYALALYDSEFYSVYNGKTMMNHTTFAKKYGFPARFFPFYRAICGDPSDNITGVPHVGEATAKNIMVYTKDSGIIDEETDMLSPKDVSSFIERLPSAAFKKTILTRIEKLQAEESKRIVGRNLRLLAPDNLDHISTDIAKTVKIKKNWGMDNLLYALEKMSFHSLLEDTRDAFSNLIVEKQEEEKNKNIVEEVR